MIRKTAYAFGALIVLLVIFIVGLDMYFTSDRLKSMTEPAIEDAIRLDVEIGEMSLEFIDTFPGAGLSISNFLIPGSRQDTAASFREVVVAIDLIPLFSKQVNITDLMIDEPVINYHIYEDGSLNFDFEPVEDDQQQPADTADVAMQIDVPSVSISEGSFSYRDDQQKTLYVLHDVNGNVGMNYGDLITTDIALSVSKTQAVVDTVTYVDGLAFSINETSTLDLDNEIITLESGGISFQGFELDLRGAIKSWSADSPTIDLVFESSSDDFGALMALIPETYQQQIGAYKAEGSLAFSGTVQGSFGEEQLPSLSVTLEIDDGRLTNPQLKQPIEQISILAAVTNQQIELTKLNMAAGSNHLSANGVITKWMSDNPIANLKSNLSANLATLPDFYPIDPDTLTMRGQLNADISMNGPVNDGLNALKEANFNLNDGYLNYYKYDNALRDIAVKGAIVGEQLRLDNFQLMTDSSSVGMSGTIDSFASDNPIVNLKGQTELNLAEINDFYPIQPYLSRLSGLVDANLTARGAVYDLTELDLNGTMTLSSAQIVGDSLPTSAVRSLNASVTLDPNTITFETISTQIGEADLNFQGSVANFRQLFAEQIKKPITVEGVLSSKLLHYDSMFPISADTAAGEPIPMEIPNMTADIDIAADSIVYMGIGFYDASAFLNLTSNEINITEISTGLMEGLVSGELNWKIPDPLATNISFDGRVDSIASSKFFREFQVLGETNSIYDNLSGAMNAKISYHSDLNAYLEPELKTSVADGSFGMSGSVLENHPAQLALARFLKQDDLKRLKIDDWQADYAINDGILELRNMNIRSGNLEMQLDGQQNLLTGNLDYQATLLVPKRYAGNLSKIITKKGVDVLTQDDGRVMVPLKITGTSDNVSYQPDDEVIKKLLKDALKDKVKNTIGNIFGDG